MQEATGQLARDRIRPRRTARSFNPSARPCTNSAQDSRRWFAPDLNVRGGRHARDFPGSPAFRGRRCCRHATAAGRPADARRVWAGGRAECNGNCGASFYGYAEGNSDAGADGRANRDSYTNAGRHRCHCHCAGTGNCEPAGGHADGGGVGRTFGLRHYSDDLQHGATYGDCRTKRQGDEWSNRHEHTDRYDSPDGQPRWFAHCHRSRRPRPAVGAAANPVRSFRWDCLGMGFQLGWPTG